MKKKLTLAVALTLIFGLNAAQAHYLWLTIDGKKSPRQVDLVFEGGLKPGDGQYIDRFVARGTTWIQDKAGIRELKMTDTKVDKLRWLSAAIEETGPLSLASYGRFGVYRYGETDVQLHYYAKHLEVSSSAELAKLARSEKLDLDIVPSAAADGTVTLKVLWKGKPAVGKKLTCRGGTKLDLETDENGVVSFKPEKPGLHSFLAKLDEDISGHDPDDKIDYTIVRHQSSLTLRLPLAGE